MNIPSSTLRQQYVRLNGGLDITTPLAQATPGTLLGAQNIEQRVDGGMERFPGYERYDGRPAPSEAVYYEVAFADGTSAPSPGATVTTATGSGILIDARVDSGSWAGADAAGTLALRSFTGAITPGQNLQVSAVTFAAAASSQQLGVGGMVDYEARQKAAIEAARAAITTVPGSGPIRGVAVLEGVVHAVRDNSGGTAAVIYKASPTGWQALTLLREVGFTGTAIPEPQEGNTLHQAGDNATIRRVVLESGIWGSGAVSGRFIITAPSPTEFSSGSANANFTGTGITVTLTGPSTPISLSPGGKWKFIEHNFTGAQDTRRLYGVDGVNKPIEIGQDGVVVPINTGMSLLFPAKAIEAHRNHLFLGYGSNLQHSAIGEPYKWTVLGGAAAIAAGDEVTDLLSVAGSEQSAALMVMCKDSAHIVYGSSAGNWQLVMLSKDAGAKPYSAQQLGPIITVDTEGIRALAPTDVFGNFSVGNASDQIKRLVDNFTPSASVIDRKRGRYRVWKADGTGFVGTPLPRGRWAWTPMVLSHTVNVACEGEVDARARMFFGGDSGYVYEITDCRSMDGEEFDWFARTSFLSMGMPTIRKAFRGVDIELRGQSAATIRVLADFSYGAYGTDSTPIAATPVQEGSVAVSGGLWDVDVYEEAAWDSPFAAVVKQRHYGVGTNMSLLIGGRSDFELPVEVIGMTINYIPRNIER